MENQLPVVPFNSDTEVLPKKMEPLLQAEEESSGAGPDWVFYSDFSDQGDAVAHQQQL